MANLVVTTADVRPLPDCKFRQFTAGEGLSLGDLVYMKSDGKVWKADASAEATAFPVGVVASVSTFGAETAVAGDRVGVALEGPVAGFTCTAGSLGYVSNDAGKVADAAGDVAVCIGVALPDNVFLIKFGLVAPGTVPTGSIGTTELEDGAVTKAKLADGAASEGITGDKLQFSANVSTLGAVPILFRIDQAAGANGDTEITLAQKIRVIDFWVQLTGAGVSSSTCQLKSTSSAISDAVATSGSDNAVVRCASIDDANATIASGGKLRITGANGATQPALTAYVLAVPVA